MNHSAFTALALTTLLASCTALAMPQGAFWVEIPVVDHPDDPTDLSGYRTYALYVQLEEGDTVNYADLGLAGPNTGLHTTQAIFDHPFGDHLARTDEMIEFLPDLFYDTHLGLGDLDGTAKSPSEIIVQFFNTADPSNITGIWGGNAIAGFSPANPGGGLFTFNNENVIWLGQITISSECEYLDGCGDIEFFGGQLFLNGQGPNGNFGQEIALNGVVDIPSAYSLGAGTLLGEFQMLTPACGAENVTMHNASLTWESHPDAFLYNVIVTTDFRFLGDEYSVNVQGSTSHIVPAGVLEPCTTYFWSVRADDFILSTRLASNWEFCAFTTSALGDINADGAVDTADLGIMIGQFQTANPASDLNGDGVVDTADLGQLIAGFGLTCD